MELSFPPIYRGFSAWDFAYIMRSRLSSRSVLLGCRGERMTEHVAFLLQ